MQIDLNRISVNDRFFYDDTIKFDPEIYHNKEIKELKNMHLKGEIYYNSMEILEINLEVKGTMIISDSITLEPLEHNFQVSINEEYSLDDPYFKEYYEKEQNILDIMQILWENIVLEVPISLTKAKDATLSGDGWSLGSIEKKQEIDPRLAKLSEVLNERKE